jgi:hypothetical protein
MHFSARKDTKLTKDRILKSHAQFCQDTGCDKPFNRCFIALVTNGDCSTVEDLDRLPHSCVLAVRATTLTFRYMDLSSWGISEGLSPRTGGASGSCESCQALRTFSDCRPNPIFSMIPRDGQSAVRFLCAGTSSGSSDPKTTGSIRLDANVDGSQLTVGQSRSLARSSDPKNSSARKEVRTRYSDLQWIDDCENTSHRMVSRVFASCVLVPVQPRSLVLPGDDGFQSQQR